MEVFKDIVGYEGLYRISNTGRVKSLKYKKEKVLKSGINDKGYLKLNLLKDGEQKTKKIHQLVAMAFLGHIPCGHKIVVDHINNDKIDNSLDNLQLITNRENSSKDRKSTSKYTGVSWSKKSNKWIVHIQIDGKNRHLGLFKTELEASKRYELALKKLEKCG